MCRVNAQRQLAGECMSRRAGRRGRKAPDAQTAGEQGSSETGGKLEAEAGRVGAQCRG